MDLVVVNQDPGQVDVCLDMDDVEDPVEASDYQVDRGLRQNVCDQEP